MARLGPAPAMRRRALDTGSESATLGAAEPAAGAKVPATLRDPGAIRFWIAVVLTGLCAGLGAALLTLLFDAAQELAWGAAEPSALFEAAWQASPERHIGLLLGAGLAISVGQWLLTRLTSGNSIDVTAAIWFQAGRMPAWRTLGTAVLSIVIVAMGAPLGREGAPKQFGVVFGNLFSSLQKLSDEQRRLIVAIGAGAGMAAVYSVPLGGALFALEVLRGALALRLVVPALAAALDRHDDGELRRAQRAALHRSGLPDLARRLPLDDHRLAVHRLVVGRVRPRDRLGLSRSPLRLAPVHRAAACPRRHWTALDRLPRAARQRPGRRPAPVPASARAGRPRGAGAGSADGDGRLGRERRARRPVHALARRRRARGRCVGRAVALGSSGRRHRPLSRFWARARCWRRPPRDPSRRWC